MMYKILEARIEFVNNYVSCIIVLVEISKGDIRAIYADTKPKNGYLFILPGIHKADDDLLQRVAAQGCEIGNVEKIFPDWRSKIK